MKAQLSLFALLFALVGGLQADEVKEAPKAEDGVKVETPAEEPNAEEKANEKKTEGKAEEKGILAKLFSKEDKKEDKEEDAKKDEEKKSDEVAEIAAPSETIGSDSVKPAESVAEADSESPKA